MSDAHLSINGPEISSRPAAKKSAKPFVEPSFEFRVIPGGIAREILDRRGIAVVDAVARAYLLHAEGGTINPDSYFLRFPENDLNRIIALPAAITTGQPVSGIKWIASFPDNIRHGIPRASAVLILNDAKTGYPIACIEGAQISAIRTAASALLAWRQLRNSEQKRHRIGVVGAGVIARNILHMLRFDVAAISQLIIHDTDPSSSAALAQYAARTLGVEIRTTDHLHEVFEADAVILATTAGRPYIMDRKLLRPDQVILNISLRDLAPELILDHWNIVDDVSHCLKAQTSPHLAEQVTGRRDFIAGTLADVMCERIRPDRSRALIFSPFGLGILDLALGQIVLADAARTGAGFNVADFFAETQRWEIA
jgi:2,3-diaminopropionate biosynthesis protein SbnB